MTRWAPRSEWVLAMLDALPNISLTVWSVDLRLLYANATRLTETRRTPEEVLGCTLSDLCPEYVTRVEPLLRDCLRTRANIMDGLALTVSKGGEIEHWCLDFIYLESPERESACGIRACNTTERHRAQQEAIEAVRVRDEYMSVASHELRTPLTSIMLQAEILKKAAETERVRAGIERIIKHGNRISRMVTLLLDVSRISKGEVHLERETFDFAHMVQDTLNRLKIDADSARCPVLLDAQSVVGAWDRTRAEQIVTNLLTNAFKYGSGKPVTVSVRSQGDRLILRVQDNGIGIRPEDQTRIFEQFQRVSTRAPGLGLGLWIAHKIVTAFEGTIGVESEAGKGAIFTVDLPCRAV